MTWGAPAAALVDASGVLVARNGRRGVATMPPPWEPNQPCRDQSATLPKARPRPPRPRRQRSPRQPCGVSAHALWTAAAANPAGWKALWHPHRPERDHGAWRSTPGGQEKMLNLTSFEWTILRAPPRTYWLDVAWPLFGRYLSEIRDSADSVGAPTVLLAIPEMASSTTRCTRGPCTSSVSGTTRSIGTYPKRQLALQAAQGRHS